MRGGSRWPRIAAPFALPLAATLLLVLGAVAAQLHGRLPAPAVTILVGLIVAGVCATAEPVTALPVGLVGWLTAAAFGRPPYGELHPTARQAAISAGTVLAAAALGVVTGSTVRWATTPRDGTTLVDVERLSSFAGAVDKRRQLAALLSAAVVLPALTAVLTATRDSLTLADDLLLYLLAVVAVAVVGGFWPAIVTATAASLLVNWFFTEPLHTFTIAQPDNLFALLLFVLVAVSVSSVVHFAARRSAQARQSAAEAEALLQLARGVLSGDDTPDAVVRHLHDLAGHGVQLLERSGERWVALAAAGDTSGPDPVWLPIRDDLALVVHAPVPVEERRLMAAGAGQAAAAVDRDRLRTQAAQAEALSAANRMRTALLAAVSHDLRTPLASIKAGISSLRQTDVRLPPADEAELLETIEESTDRLASIIDNLLDMTRLQTGALQPYLRRASIDEIAARALVGLPGADTVRVEVPEDLPLVRTDAGLLERALANLISNATRHAGVGRPTELIATREDGAVLIRVVDFGRGVPAADQERIFQPFQRLGDQNSTTGIGLGLAVARGFVEAIGGTLTASDTPGGGLTMTVALPIDATATTEPQVVS